MNGVRLDATLLIVTAPCPYCRAVVDVAELEALGDAREWQSPAELAAPQLPAPPLYRYLHWAARAPRAAVERHEWTGPADYAVRPVRGLPVVDTRPRRRCCGG